MELHREEGFDREHGSRTGGKHRMDTRLCVEAEKITMKPKELPELSVSDMEALEEFIDWEE